MNLLADESVDRQIVERLRRDGHVVLYIAEVEPSLPDNIVFDRANENLAILLTTDKDFGELVFRDQRLISNGVVLLRLAGLTTEKKAETVADAMMERETELPRHFTVISADRVRIRGRN